MILLFSLLFAFLFFILLFLGLTAVLRRRREVAERIQMFSGYQPSVVRKASVFEVLRSRLHEIFAEKARRTDTGHDGSLTTAHANSPRDVLSRLETMVLMSGLDLPVRAIRDQISSALDLIIHQERIQDGSRKITYITEVQKMEGDVIVLQDLFRYKQTGFDENGKAMGQFVPTGLQPQFLAKFKAHNVEFPKFMQRAGGAWGEGE